jgi:fructokinase
MTSRKLFGGMEGGGTKFACAVGRGPQDIREEIRFLTTTPEETLGRAVAFFRKFELDAIGLAPFGPLNLDPASPAYGSIASTPKDGWSNAGVLSVFRRAFDLPLVIDLDVNAAAFGEWYWIPERKSMESLVYYTIGTGIGAGVISNGCILHGLTHPEAGHMRLPHDRKKDPFPGVCPFHGDCFEGLASGPAIARHWRQPAEQLPDDHPAWELEAAYIAYALVNTILQVSPRCIVVGGGVMEHRALFPAVRRKVREYLNGYVCSPIFDGSLEGYIVPPALGKRSGILGAIAMAKMAARPRPVRRTGP